jgi:glycine dehydrogenase subunit 2
MTNPDIQPDAVIMPEQPVQLVFEKGLSGAPCRLIPEDDPPAGLAEPDLAALLGKQNVRATPPGLPDLAEVQVVRHYTALSQKNFGVESGPYPLGSCTMKYNPKIHEDLAALAGFAGVHPLQGPESTQGCLRLMDSLEKQLCAICGMARMTFQPSAGAHGEMTGLLLIKAWHESRGDQRRKVIIIPDSAHGTNPASATMTGHTVREIKSGPDGLVSMDALEDALSDETAGLMLTNPNTLGLFEQNIELIARLVHEAGGLLYYDGANINSILMQARPGDMGFDVVHLNLHKSFSTPHGGGGPGAGPVGVSAKLVPFLPVPVLARNADGTCFLDEDRPLSIGRVRSFHGNFAVLVRAYAYILANGAEGLKEVSEAAVANANYLLRQLRQAYDVPFDQPCMHEFVLSGTRQKEQGCSTLDIAKRLIDYGCHPPTVYFPLTVKEAMMVEPTETEDRAGLDRLAEAFLKIADEVETRPELLHDAPHRTPVSRPDEVQAARRPVLRR